MNDRVLRERVKPAPDTRGTFSVDGLQLAYEIHGPGSAPPVVFVPGVGFPRVYFRPVAALLKDRLRCVLFDPRGAGDSDGPEDDAAYDLDGQAHDVIALLDHLDVRRAWIVGHSLGSNIGIACAARFPDRVDGVVVISSALSASLVEDHLRDVFATADPALRAVIERHEKRGPVFVGDGPPDEYNVASATIYQPHVVRGRIDSEVLWAMRQSVAAAGALWGRDSAFRITGLFKNVDQRELVGEVTRPMVAIAGRDDEYARTSLPFFEHSPRHRVVRMPDSLHHAHVEEPARVAEIILDAILPPTADCTPRLRLDIAVEVEDGGVRVEDKLTGFQFELPPIAHAVVKALGRPLVEVVSALAEALGDDAPEDADLDEAVRDLIAQLGRVGVLQEGKSRSEIERLQKQSRAEARAQERFHDVVAAITRAYESVPLHRKRMDDARITPADLASPDDLKRIPLMEKSDIRRNFPNGLVAAGVDVQKLLDEGALTIGATSGTSAERLQVLFDWSKGGLPARAHELWDLDDDVLLTRGAVFTTPLCAGFECHLGEVPPEQRTRGNVLTLNSTEDLFAFSDAQVRAAVDELTKHDAHVLFLHPWYGAWLCRRAIGLGLELPSPTVILTSYQHLTRKHRRMISAAFGAPVFSYWGATDLGGPLLGAECHAGRVHVREDHVYLELDAAAPGLELDAALPGLADGRASIIVTLLGQPVMPLVRYRISDVVRFHDDPCPCALGGEWQTLELLGRARDAVRSKSGQVLLTKDIDDALGDDGPDFWRLTQSGAAYTLEVLGGIERESADRLEALLEAKLKVVEVKRFSPERSLKFRQVCSL